MEKFNEIINNNTPVLVDFWADWCAPCHQMSPVVNELKQEMGEKLRVLKINVDKNPVIASQYQIRSIPTFMLFKNGKVKWNGLGVMPYHELKNAVVTNS